MKLKMKRKLKYLSALTLALGLLVSGCVKETLEVCYSGLYLRFHYTLNPTDDNLFGSDVNELAILVFDDKGLFYDEFLVQDRSQLENHNSIYLPLPDGKWDIVAWASEDAGELTRHYGLGTVNVDAEQHEFYDLLVKGVTTIDDARLWIKNRAGSNQNGRDVITDDLSRLYHGEVYSVETQTTTEPAPTHDVAMMQNTNTLRIIITGLGSSGNTRATSRDFAVSADMVNGRYEFDNSVCPHAIPLTYENGAWEDNGKELQYDLTVLRPFVDDDTSELILSSSLLAQAGYPDGEIAIPIVPTILESPDYRTQTDLDRFNLYEFVFDFDTDMSFTITINGWKVVHVIPGVS